MYEYFKGEKQLPLFESMPTSNYNSLEDFVKETQEEYKIPEKQMILPFYPQQLYFNF